VEPEGTWEQLAITQHGVLSREQALTAGISVRAIDGRVASGRWRALYRGVYLAIPFGESWRQRLMAAVLHGGPSALASHRAAASLWQLDGFEPAPLEISVKSGRRIPGVIAHRRRADDDPPMVPIDGIPTTGMERTLLDVAAVVPLRLAGRALDDALRRGPATLDSLRAELPAAGRAGRRALGRLLDERDDQDSSAESRLESMLLRVLRRARVPLPVAQYRVMEHGVPIARLDFAYPDHRLGLEADGYRWHSGAERWREDLRRDNRLKLLGWTVLRFSWRDLRDHPDRVANQVRTALEQLAQGSLRRLPLR